MTTAVDLMPDAEAAIGTILRDAGIRSYSSIPNKPTYPLVKVARVGGTPITRMRLDAAEIQLDVYADTKSAARALAARARQLIWAAEGTTVSISSGNAWVSGVEDSLGLSWLPDPSNVPINRYVFSVRVFLHAA